MLLGLLSGVTCCSIQQCFCVSAALFASSWWRLSGGHGTLAQANVWHRHLLWYSKCVPVKTHSPVDQCTEVKQAEDEPGERERERDAWASCALSHYTFCHLWLSSHTHTLLFHHWTPHVMLLFNANETIYVQKVCVTRRENGTEIG